MNFDVKSSALNQSVEVEFADASSTVEVDLAENDASVDVVFSEKDASVDVEFGKVQHITKIIGGEPYDGEYEVTPKMMEQTLPTRAKVMEDDVTIKKIPVFVTSNTSGGTTVYIGSEV